MTAGLQALLSHWWRHPFQLVTLLIGLATATALWSGVQAINAEARASYDRAASALGQTPRPRITAPDGVPLEQEHFVALRRAGWLVTPLIEGRLSTEAGSVRLVGIDPFTLPPADLPDALEGDTALDLSFLTPPGQLITSPATAERLEGADLPPRLALDGIAPGLAYADIGIAQDLMDMDGRLTALLVLDDQPLGRPPLEEVAPGLVLRPPAQGGDISRLTDSFHLNLTAFGLLSFAVGLFIVRGAIGLAFEQRRPVFRTLRALGLSTRVLLGLLLAELLVFALVAGTLGIALGWLIASLLLPDVAATLRGLYGASVEGALTLRPAWWLSGVGIAVLGTLIAATASLWQVARLPLLAPAQPRAWAMASERTMRRQAVVALALIVFAVGVGLYGAGLVGGFVMLGALLVGAALLLPLLLHVALRLGARTARTPLADWFWADTRQQVPGLSLALMALLLALAANIGVGTMVSSFRLTFTGWLDQRLASELYVSSDDEAQAAALQEWLAPRTDAVLPIWRASGEIAGAPAEIYGVADHPTYRDNWPILAALPDVWDLVARGDGILVNEQLARREDLSPGDTMALPGWETRVAGIYSDYGNPSAQVLVGLETFDTRFPEAERLDFGLRLPQGEADALARALVEEFGLPAENIVDQASLKAFSLQVFERTFTVTGALNVLTLTVAGFAILTSLMTLARMRLPQVAPVWALGLTRARLARLELLRALLLAALTAVAALPVGLLLAWVLLAVINVEAFGWRLPMHVFPADWALLGALALLAAGLAALWPARRIATIPPSELLKVFANER
ncbi:ABC transporter permease [Tranquillimonas alkanivorans]|uniref:ABC transporter permease n=1 Tax=Tranquillimonas alkanivorans TaxID=441119 RepID=UPI000B862A09|nr:ABC transporter permease [Tranquillimonas alkanivorans]